MAYKNVQVIDKPEFLEVSDFDFYIHLLTWVIFTF